MEELAQQAIYAALSGDWQKALELNSLILKEYPQNTEALNRTARAHAKLGEIAKARKISRRVLAIDPFDSIAQKSLRKWQKITNSNQANTTLSSVHDFLIDEPGKIKIVNLTHLGNPSLVASLYCGDEVKVSSHGRRFLITTQDGDYLGRLPDDICAKLRVFFKDGENFKALVKSIDKNEVKILLKTLGEASSEFKF